ncbi:TetR/AcrR family transcriptional regulator [Amycolatopsis jiangsuensis]|uniref:AcrR family transcriptional regulator n=1 Tax=Amycolatopsis jiangsuensis TaxID=1181879 RepID=A0A840IZV0_9PSEU|nr:TetR/AcrR family transcriptional regulator [Amycolatopsis jiangsuensis]MBB4686688.1 AcrR family transcriptional regulator [Amycolatopsis jiangsuensis]
MAEVSGTRPGGRSARVREAVYDAAIDLYASGETEAAIPRIAERAGVNPTSLYRRWGTCANLLLEAAVSRLRATTPMPDTGSLRGDVEAWATGVERSLTMPDSQVLLPALVAARSTDASPAEHLLARRADLERMLAVAAERGEPTPVVEDLLDYVLAPLYLRALFRMPIETGLGARLAERLLTERAADPGRGAGRDG